MLTRRGADHRARAVAVIGVFLSLFSPLAPGQGCDPPAARVVSAQGTVELRRANQSQWLPAALDERLCAGDGLRTGSASRAALVLPDETVTRLNQETAINFPPSRDDKRTWLEVLEGAVQVITRDRRALRVLTPFANAGIDGTEFLVTVSATQAEILVFEGQVTVQGAGASAAARSGERVTVAGPGAAPVVAGVVHPRDAVQWTLYYPPVTAGADTDVGRAARALAVGRAEEAGAALDGVLAREPANAEALALRAVIALTQNDRDRARELSGQAVAADPRSAAALVARSYVQQADLDLAGALLSLRQATEAEPGNALALARLAEIRLAFGDHAGAIADARRAVAADPALGLPHTVLGFAELAGADTAAARAAFDEAICRDSAAPLPRLGRGLALIRDGELSAGREEIELAVILDPGNALIRSYMGKAYYEEKRDGLAATQLDIAKALDPEDPTAFFYDAIRKQTVNRPVEALDDLRRSAGLNDRRAVYRSGFLLDDDAAARNASVSATYNELAFQSLAVAEGAAALAENFGNASAHRLLGNAYASVPRYDISRVSEALQAQIRQPLAMPTTNLLDTTDNLAILRNTGPARPGLNEYNGLFNRDQLGVQADLIGGSRGTWGDQFIARGLEGDFGFSLGQLHYETDGFTSNDTGRKDVYDGFLQWGVTPDDSIEVNLRSTDFRRGYTFYEFDPPNSFPTQIDEETTVLRLNGRHGLGGGGDWIWTAATEDRRRDVNYFPDGFLVTRTDAGAYAAEVQRLDRIGAWRLISGAGYVRDEQDFPIEAGEIDATTANAYVYAQVEAARTLTLIGGLAYEDLDQRYSVFTNRVSRQRLNPKLGVVWSALPGTTLRAAAFSALRRPFIGSQTIEPTEVAGFNQFFTGFEQFYGDPVGTVSNRAGIAVDQAFSASLFGGLEGTVRRLEVPFVAADKDYTCREKTARAYLYRTFQAGGWNATLSLSGEYEDIQRPQGLTGPEGIMDLRTSRVPLGISWFWANGLTARASTSYVRQYADFSIDRGLPVVEDDDDAWITDIALEYRLPRRFGIVALGCRNVFDSAVTIVESDPLSPQTAERRLCTGSISLTF